jgi:hypothetical protein
MKVCGGSKCARCRACAQQPSQACASSGQQRNRHKHCPRLQLQMCRAGSDSVIENLPDICDDFQCNSSPAVERTVRSFAKNIEWHTTWTIAIFAQDVVYRVRCYPTFCLSAALCQAVWACSCCTNRLHKQQQQ